MKRVGNLYHVICDIDIIMDMYDRKVKVNTKNKKKIEEFEHFYSINIKKIKEILITKKYVPGRYHIFLIREPKLRIIMSQSIFDKIINHLIAKYFLVDIFDKTLIDSTVATRLGKGTHYGLRLFKNSLNYFKNKYDTFYILKFDISKYFYNIDHDVVKELIRKKMKDKDILDILDSIIDSTDSNYINQCIDDLKEKEISKIRKLDMNEKEKELKIKEIENLPLYKKGKGFPIGNMTSQIIATFYLNELDHFIKEKLGIKHYVRYMDDGVLFHHDKEYLKYCLEEIKIVLNKYKLTLNKKTRIYSNKDEVEFLGFRFLVRDRIVVKASNKTKKRFKKRCHKVFHDYHLGLVDYKKLESVVNSYKGHLKWGDTNKLMYQYFGDFTK